MNRSFLDTARAEHERPLAGEGGPPPKATASGSSGSRWRAVDPTAVGAGVLGIDGRWMSVSPSTCRLTGRREADLLGTTLEAVTHPDDATAEREHLRALLAGGTESYEMEKRLVRPSGAVAWVRQRITGTRDGSGSATHLVWQAHEIVESGQGQGARTYAEEWLRLVIASAPIVLWCVDRNGVFTLSEGRGLVGMGLTGGELVGRSALEVLGDVRVIEGASRPTTAAEMLQRALAGVECDCLTQAGATTYDTRMVPLHGRGGDVVGVIGVGTDVTELISAEAALRESQAGFRALIEGSPELIAIHRGERVVYLNPCAVSTLGWADARDLLDRPIFDLFHPEDRSAVASPPSGASPRELRMLRRDGGIIAAEVVAVPIVWSREPATAIIARDVTERRQMQAHRLQMDRLVALGSLAAGVAHEINNPLTYVVANIELVSQALSAFAREHRGTCALVDGDAVAKRIDGLIGALRSAGDGAGRVRQIVKDLRTFSRTESESRALLDVRSVLDPVIHMAWNEIRHRARFCKDCRDVPLVEANEARLGQVFLNLLLNAAHAIPEGRADENEIRVTTYTDESGRAVVEVSDTGAGIAEENRSRIFDPFFTTKPVGVGTGLGLSICLGTVTSLGGEITVDANGTTGSVFRVALPPARLDRRRPDSRRFAAPLRPLRSRVLVVDDEPLIGDSLRMSLGDQHDVRAVTRASEALERVSAGERFDVILCDLMMPDMTGMDLYAALSCAAPVQAARIVFVTGGAFTPRAREFLDTVPNRRLEKPFELAEIAQVIGEMGRLSSDE